MWAQAPQLLIGVKNQSPLVVGINKDESFLSGDFLHEAKVKTVVTIINAKKVRAAE